MLDLEGREEVNRLTGHVIGAAQKVHAVLGPGFLERVYENALAFELSRRGVGSKQQCALEVRYCGRVVGDYVADMLVEGKVVVELKAVAGLDRAHRAQCIHYLRATGLAIGLLLNFGAASLQWRRVVNDF